MPLLHCTVGWSVFLFYVPSTLSCGLFNVIYVPSTLCFGLVRVLCPFHSVLWVGCLFSASTLCCGLVGVLCPFYTVLWVDQCSVSLYTVL